MLNFVLVIPAGLATTHLSDVPLNAFPLDSSAKHNKSRIAYGRFCYKNNHQCASSHRCSYNKSHSSSGFLVALCARDSGGVRTHDPQLRRLLLYPTELRNHRHFVRLGRKMLRKGNQKLIIHNPFAENSPHSEAKKSSFGGGVSQNPQKQPCFALRFGCLGRIYYLSHDFANGLFAVG